MSGRAKRPPPTSPSDPSPTKRKRGPKDPGGSADARRTAVAILEIWAGVRTPPAAASALGVSLPRYYQLEQRAVGALVAACEPRPRGPGPNLERQIRSLERQLATSRRDCARLQALLRTSQRTIGLPAIEPPSKPAPGKRRPNRPTARALRLAEVLSPDSPGENPGDGLERTNDSAVATATSVAAAAAHGARGDAP